ncbi:ArpU family phage packaging/lysis transcriptional regulator [Parafrankia elaeagni]|uniref:ArpU family phage packaging/lysis transcriptional regulator n=1 Tax=Parafrankia elaeagni TaxID=222534 RepID=UPI0003779B05|nr:ArpU family phage packaging/lysis transcriptional regulator [Parafrankia elaeagni]
MISDKELQRIIAQELKLYKTYKVAIENKRELTAAGLNKVFPVLVDSDAAKELKCKQIDRALSDALTNDERMILERKYFGRQQETDLSLYLDLGLSKGQYYEIKKQAIEQLAIALGII